MRRKFQSSRDQDGDVLHGKPGNGSDSAHLLLFSTLVVLLQRDRSRYDGVVNADEQFSGQVLPSCDAPIVGDETLASHSPILLDVRIVCIGVQHDDRVREHEARVGVGEYLVKKKTEIQRSATYYRMSARQDVARLAALKR